MCRLCDQGQPQFHDTGDGLPASATWNPRRGFLKAAAAGSAAASGLGLFAAPGKEADIIILDAEAINVAPLNHVPGAVVSLMDRTNVETVIVAGQVRKWKGKMKNLNLVKLRRDLEASRDYLFEKAGIKPDLFRAS